LARLLVLTASSAAFVGVSSIESVGVGASSGVSSMERNCVGGTGASGAARFGPD